MQQNNLPLISVHRDNYIVPKGEERKVHYKIERLVESGRMRISHPDLIKSNVKQFDIIKRSLELQGYMVEILWHPDGKYTDIVIPNDVNREMAEKDAEIARLKAELAMAKVSAKSANPIVTKEETMEMPVENEGKTAELPTEKVGERKIGRPKKN